MNMLKIPMYIPIFFEGIELDSMAYGMDNMLPQAIPTKAKLHFRFALVSGSKVIMVKKPSPPNIKDVK